MTWTVARHRSGGDFLDRAEAWLMRSEDVHNLFLSLAYALHEAGELGDDVLLATVERDDGVHGCAIRTPPYKLLATEMPTEAAPAVARCVAELYEELPAVLGPEPVAEAIAVAWVGLRGGGWSPGMEQRVYRLDEVIPPARKAPGRVRKASEADVELAFGWGEGFARDAGQQFRISRERVEGWVRDGVLYIWEDRGEPRALAVAHGVTPNGARVGYVYTPPEWRGQGFASACVAAVSQALLDGGSDFCVLYTDVSNPTSNAIYQRLGYRPIADVRDYDLVPERAFG